MQLLHSHTFLSFKKAKVFPRLLGRVEKHTLYQCEGAHTDTKHTKVNRMGRETWKLPPPSPGKEMI